MEKQLHQSTDGIIVGQAESHSYKHLIWWVGGMAIILLLIIGLVVVSTHKTVLPLAEQRAVAASARAANTFPSSSNAYAMVQLNTAIDYADAKKCPEARAVYDAAAKNKTDLTSADLLRYKQKIEKLCKDL